MPFDDDDNEDGDYEDDEDDDVVVVVMMIEEASSKHRLSVKRLHKTKPPDICKIHHHHQHHHHRHLIIIIIVVSVWTIHPEQFSERSRCSTSNSSRFPQPASEAGYSSS